MIVCGSIRGQSEEAIQGANSCKIFKIGIVKLLFQKSSRMICIVLKTNPGGFNTEPGLSLDLQIIF